MQSFDTRGLIYLQTEFISCLKDTVEFIFSYWFGSFLQDDFVAFPGKEVFRIACTWFVQAKLHHAVFVNDLPIHHLTAPFYSFQSGTKHGPYYPMTKLQQSTQFDSDMSKVYVVAAQAGVSVVYIDCI